MRIICLVVATLAACSTPSGPELAGSSFHSAPSLPTATDLDVTALVERQQFSFQADGDRFTGRGVHYEVAVHAGSTAISTKHPTTGDAAALSLRTRGDVVSTRVTDDGLLSARHDSGVVEVLENTDSGLHQSWQIDEPPGSSLTIEVDVDGLPFVGASEGGLHFANKAGLGFVYSHATWIDANGARTPVPSVWSGDHVRLHVPEEVVADSTFPVVLDPVIGPETALDEPVIGTSPEFRMEDPAVCADGSQWMVVWLDWRFSASRQDRPTLLGTFVGADGGIERDQSFVIAPQVDPRAPQCVWDGSQYVAAWFEDSLPFTRRISVDGEPLTPTRSALGQDSDPTVLGIRAASYGGHSWFLTWFGGTFDPESGQGSGQRCQWQMLDSQNTVIAADYSMPCEGPPDVADAGDGLLLATPVLDNNGTSYIAVQRVIDPLNEDIGWSTTIPESGAPHIASSGAGLSMVVWVDEASVRGVRLDALGQVLDPAPLLLGTDPRDQDIRQADVAWAGDNWVVVWSQTRTASSGGLEVMARSVGVDADLGVPTPVVVGEARLFGLAVETRGTDVLAAFDGIRGVRIASNGEPLDSDVLWPAGVANSQTVVQLHRGADGWLLVWQDNRFGPGRDVFSLALDAHGLPLGAPRRLFPEIGYLTGVATAWNGAAYVVAAAGHRDALSTLGPYEYWIGLAQISETGAIDYSQYPLSRFALLSHISANSRGSVISYGDGVGQGHHVSFDSTGAVSNSDLGVGTGGGPLIMLDDGFLSVSSSGGALTARVYSHDGVLTHSEPLGIHEDAVLMSIDRRPSGLVARFELPDGVYDAALGETGTLLGPLQRVGEQPSIPLSLRSYGVTNGLWVAAGIDEGNDQAVLSVGTPETGWSGPLLLADAPSTPPVASDGTEGVLVAYTRTVGFVSRAYLRFIEANGQGATTCTDSDDCVDGACVDGFCCDRACDSPCEACAASLTGFLDGICAPVPAGTACGDPQATNCTDPDSCDGFGNCAPHHVRDGTACTATTFCLQGDICLEGACVDGADPTCDAHEVCVEEEHRCGSCGDALVDGDEACDDGVGNSDVEPDACRTDCTLAACGDGVVDSGEECDGGLDCTPDCSLLDDTDSVVLRRSGCSAVRTPVLTGWLLLPLLIVRVRRESARVS